jgi:hypothetical protein
LHFFNVALNAADSASVGSTRTFTTCFTLGRVTGGTDIPSPPGNRQVCQSRRAAPQENSTVA